MGPGVASGVGVNVDAGAAVCDGVGVLVSDEAFGVAVAVAAGVDRVGVAVAEALAAGEALVWNS